MLDDKAIYNEFLKGCAKALGFIVMSYFLKYLIALIWKDNSQTIQNHNEINFELKRSLITAPPSNTRFFSFPEQQSEEIVETLISTYPCPFKQIEARFLNVQLLEGNRAAQLNEFGNFIRTISSLTSQDRIQTIQSYPFFIKKGVWEEKYIESRNVIQQLAFKQPQLLEKLFQKFNHELNILNSKERLSDREINYLTALNRRTHISQPRLNPKSANSKR